MRLSYRLTTLGCGLAFFLSASAAAAQNSSQTRVDRLLERLIYKGYQIVECQAHGCVDVLTEQPLPQLSRAPDPLPPGLTLLPPEGDAKESLKDPDVRELLSLLGS